jgi:DNA repair protein RadC
MTTTFAVRYIIPPGQSYTFREDPPPPMRQVQKDGPDALSVGELLEVALGRADGLADKLGEYSLAQLAQIRSVPEAVGLLDINHVQATRLVALIGLGRRLFQPTHSSMATIRGAEDVFNLTHSMGYLPKEQLRVLLINRRYQVFHEEVLMTGGDDLLEISPVDILQAPVERRAKAIVLVHNHPGGTLEPSQSDKEFTQKLTQAAAMMNIELLDHLVVTQAGYRSCK